MEENTKCQSCEVNDAIEEHTCPFATEIHENYRLCNCCEECMHECCMDI